MLALTMDIAKFVRIFSYESSPDLETYSLLQGLAVNAVEHARQ